MKKLAVPLITATFLAGCGDFSLSDQNGINDVDLETSGTESSTQSIERYEVLDGMGGGYAEKISYDKATDTFKVDNLAFDGNNSYARGSAISTLGGYMVFDGKSTVTDSFGGKTIDQFIHRAIYGISDSGDTEFGIVRTGEYGGYGFGGFVYMRNGDVTIPTTGQAGYDGKYAGVRVFQNKFGIELVEGDVKLGIDFRDFNDGYGVKGEIYNRVAFDSDGNPITLAGDVYSREVHMPDIKFLVGPGVMSDNGILEGGVASYAANNAGAVLPFEEGKYYGIMSGTDANEIVGIIVVESKDPRHGSPWDPQNAVKVQETGGFIAYRD